MVYEYGYLPYRYGYLPYQNGIWANDMGDDSIDMVISHIDMGYLVTLLPGPTPCGISTGPVVPQATMLARPPHTRDTENKHSNRDRSMNYLQGECLYRLAGSIHRFVIVRVFVLNGLPAAKQGLTLVHFSAQLEPCLTHTKHPTHPKHPLTPP